jgi:hypothetical protein
MSTYFDPFSGATNRSIISQAMPFRQDVLSVMEDLASKPVTRFGEEWPVVYGRHRRSKWFGPKHETL